MENKKLEISKELLLNLPIEELVDLKIEIDDLVNKMDEIVEKCNETLK